MKLAEKFFNESYENERRFRLQAEIEKAKKLEEDCLKLFEKLILPTIEKAVKSGLYSIDIDVGELLDQLNQFKLEGMFVGIRISEINLFLRREMFIVTEDKANDIIKISWKLDKSPMTGDKVKL